MALDAEDPSAANPTDRPSRRFSYRGSIFKLTDVRTMLDRSSGSCMMWLGWFAEPALSLNQRLPVPFWRLSTRRWNYLLKVKSNLVPSLGKCQTALANSTAASIKSLAIAFSPEILSYLSLFATFLQIPLPTINLLYESRSSYECESFQPWTA